MQQPMMQADQIGNQQQINQQMVLCPVRVVYETQILIPPGEQIQPNQTIFVSPQNTPPWVQNRLQNQVLYVQQMPNIVSPIHQNIDQNQMYLQQNYSYQIPQMISRDRPMQIQNFQNIGTNIPANSNERLYMANVGQIQNQMKQQNVQVNNQIDMQRFLRPQVNQYRPQLMVNPTQSVQNVQQMNVASAQVNPSVQTNNINIVQNIPIANPNPVMNTTNIGQIQPRLQPAPNIRPVQAAKVNTNNDNPIHVANIPNRPPIQQATKIGNMVFEHSVSNTNTIGNPLQRVQQQAYRPIQPRPQYRANITNVQTVSPVQNLPYYNQKPNQIQNYNANNNRKRKSESPDESKKKIVAFETSVQTPNIINIKTSNEIGVNTSPLHKIDDRLQMSAPQLKMVDNNPPRVVNEANLTKNNIEFMKNLTANTSMSIDKIENEKLVRNTVFTQARGRLLNDKEIKTNETTNVSNEHIIKALNTNTTRQIPNNNINHFNIKEEAKSMPDLFTSNQNEGVKVQKNINTFNSGNISAVERAPVNNSKPFNDKPIQTCDRTVTSIAVNNTIEAREALNTKLDDNTITNVNKGALTENQSTAPANIPSITANQVQEKKEVISDDNKNNTNTNINPNTLTDASKIKENNAKQIVNNSQTTIDSKVTIESNKIQSNKNSTKKKQKITTDAVIRNEKDIPDNNIVLKGNKLSIDIKVKACKVQLNSNEININPTQKVELNNKLEINDGILHKKDFKSEIDVTDVKEEDGVEKIVFKQEVYDQDILTHVLDGYVIQESNFAFPIRKPIKEKMVYNQQTEDKSKNNDEVKTPVGLPLLPFYYMHLNNEVKEEKDREVKGELKNENVEKIKKDEKGHPFSNLDQSTVRNWTVDQLIKHLYSQEWKDTASTLQEHEIDGESLFLVSKSQLLHIGISEDHSDIICEFVHS